MRLASTPSKPVPSWRAAIAVCDVLVVSSNRCRRLFNIFHPYDPVAFRLEPLLKAGGSNCSTSEGDGGIRSQGGDTDMSSPEEPVILPTWTGGLRVQYQVQRWWQDLWSR